MIYTYLLLSIKTGDFYCGITNNIQRRISEHNSGKVSMTNFSRLWRLVYAKEHSSYSEARKHEKWLKKKNRKYKINLAGQAATRYLDKLEKEGKIKQVGTVGRYVRYEKA